MGELDRLLSKEDGLKTRLGLAVAAPSRLSSNAFSGVFLPQLRQGRTPQFHMP